MTTTAKPNRARLKSIMREHYLTAMDIAEVTGRKQSTVYVWLCKSSGADIQPETLCYLESKLPEVSRRG